MFRSVKSLLAISLASAMLLSSSTVTFADESAGDIVLTGTQKAFIIGDDWGAAVSKTVVTFDAPVDAAFLDAADITVSESKKATNWRNGNLEETTGNRTVTDIYLCDEKGNRIDDESGNIIAVEMYFSPEEGGAFNCSFSTWINSWYEDYKLELTLAGEITSEGSTVVSIDVAPEIDLTDADSKIIEQTECFTESSYTASSGKEYSYASYTPDTEEKRPLVIWLHGAGEGGTDPDITVLGNEVTAFVSDKFQSIMGGAYVFAPQCPTFWMDNGEGVYVQGFSGDFSTKDDDSAYTVDLQEMIEWYVSENPGIDTDRIIIGGCSNGGYMTMRLITYKPDYYYKAYFSSEAFRDSCLTQDDINNISHIGQWYVYCNTDTTVVAIICSVMTIGRLQLAGAEDIHVSVYNNIEDTTGRFFQSDGESPYKYNSHWSWIPLFNNEVTDDSNPELSLWQWMAE